MSIVETIKRLVVEDKQLVIEGNFEHKDHKSFYVYGKVKPEYQHHYSGHHRVITAGPYSSAGGASADAASFHDHPHYSAIHVARGAVLNKKNTPHWHEVEKGDQTSAKPKHEETITELSKKTLASYVKKASDGAVSAHGDLVGGVYQKGDRKETIKRYINRSLGVKKAADKLAK